MHRAVGDRVRVRLLVHVDLLRRGLALVLVGNRSLSALLDVVVGGIDGAGDIEVEVFGFLRRKKTESSSENERERKGKERMLVGALTRYETTTETIPPTPIAARFPANIS